MALRLVIMSNDLTARRGVALRAPRLSWLNHGGIKAGVHSKTGYRMKPIVRVIGILVVLLLVAVVAIPFLVDANAFRPKLEAELTSALGREVKVGDLKLS